MYFMKSEMKKSDEKLQAEMERKLTEKEGEKKGRPAEKINKYRETKNATAELSFQYNP